VLAQPITGLQASSSDIKAALRLLYSRMVADLAVSRSVETSQVAMQPLVADPWLRCAVRHPVSLLAGMPAQRIRMR